MKTSEMNFNWGGEGYAAYDGYLNTQANPAASAGVTTPPAGATPGTGTVAPKTSAEPTASPAGDGKGVSSTPTDNEANLKQLREGYDKYKSLGDYETVSERHGTMTKLWDEASTLAKQLGHSDTELAEAFKKDPVATMYILRRDARAAAANAAKPGTRENVQSLIDKRLEEALRPEREERARQVANTRMKDFNTDTSTFIDKEYPGIREGAPKAYMLFGEIASSLLDRRLSEDPKAMATFLKGGGAAMVKEAHSNAKEIFNTALTEFQGWQMKKGNIPSKAAGAGEGAERAKFSLDDVINGDEKATKHLTSMRPRV